MTHARISGDFGEFLRDFMSVILHTAQGFDEGRPIDG
jgi:hypothetical protein